MKLVYVEWFDAESTDEWTFKAEVDHKIAVVKSIGWLIHDSKKSITLAQNYDSSNDAYSMLMKIPRGMIKKMKAVKT